MHCLCKFPRSRDCATWPFTFPSRPPLSMEAPPVHHHKSGPLPSSTVHPLFAVTRSKEAVETAKFLASYLTPCVSQHLTHPQPLSRLGHNIGPETVVHVIIALMALTASVQHWWTSLLAAGQDPMPLLDGSLHTLLLACLQSLSILMDYQCPLYSLSKPMIQQFVSECGGLMQTLWPKWLELTEQVRTFQGIGH